VGKTCTGSLISRESLIRVGVAKTIATSDCQFFVPIVSGTNKTLIYGIEINNGRRPRCTGSYGQGKSGILSESGKVRENREGQGKVREF